MLHGGGRYLKAGADSKKGPASRVRVKRLEEEVASLRQQLDLERKRSASLEQQLQAMPASLEQQLQAMRAQGETLRQPAQGGRGCGVPEHVAHGFVPVALHLHAAAVQHEGAGGEQMR